MSLALYRHRKKITPEHDSCRSTASSLLWGWLSFAGIWNDPHIPGAKMQLKDPPKEEEEEHKTARSEPMQGLCRQPPVRVDTLEFKEPFCSCCIPDHGTVPPPRPIWEPLSYLETHIPSSPKVEPEVVIGDSHTNLFIFRDRDFLIKVGGKFIYRVWSLRWCRIAINCGNSLSRSIFCKRSAAEVLRNMVEGREKDTLCSGASRWNKPNTKSKRLTFRFRTGLSKHVADRV